MNLICVSCYTVSCYTLNNFKTVAQYRTTILVDDETSESSLINLLISDNYELN